MAASESLPDGWNLESEGTEYHPRMEREYTRIAYGGPDGTILRIASVQEYGTLDGWGYHVWTDDPSVGSLALVDSLEEANEVARSHMTRVVEAAAP